jgi:hypothetical protein
MTKSIRRAAMVVSLSAALGGGATAPAVAAPAWNWGLPEELYEQTCASIGAPGLIGYQEELGTSVRAGMLVDPQDLPKVGEVFYGGAMIAAVGGCSAKGIVPEVVPPVGVELAVSAANPVRCHYTLPDGSDTPITDGCPQQLQPGTQGGFSLAPGGNPANAWSDVGRVPGAPDLSRPQLEILYFEFPLRASRPLTGLPGGPSCAERAARVGPCPRAGAGDFLQVPVKVFTLGGTPTLTPAIGLFAEPGAGGAAGGRLVSAPRSLRIRRALRGIGVTVAVPADGARVTATLSARRLGRIAVARRNSARAGTLRLRLKPTRRAARRLRRARAVTATLRVKIAVPGRPGLQETATIRLRR